jgi:hypothetical protein
MSVGSLEPAAHAGLLLLGFGLGEIRGDWSAIFLRRLRVTKIRSRFRGFLLRASHAGKNSLHEIRWQHR